MNDVDPIEPLGGTSWTRIVRRHTPGEDAEGRKHSDEDEEPEEEEEILSEDDEGHQHIDIRV